MEADRLDPSGNTYLYEALTAAYELAGDLIAADPDRITSIVLLTDGEANGDVKFPAFKRFFDSLTGTAAGNVPTFTISLGEAKLDEMADIAELTTGLAYDTRTDSLSTVFFQIRGHT